MKPGKCCQCIPESICVSIPQPSGDPCSVELDWDATLKRFAGTLSCEGEAHDLLFYFDREDEDGDGYLACYFKLRSDSLDFPESYEHEWIIGEEIQCDELTAEVETEFGTLQVTKATKITPTSCTGCRCLCECLCVTLASQDCFSTVLACWDEYEEAYLGEFDCEGTPIPFVIRPVPANEGIPEDDPEFDPYSEACVFVLEGIGDDKWAHPNCPNVSIEWEIPVEGSECEVKWIVATCSECGQCPTCDHCNENGSIIPDCTACDEIPLAYTVGISAPCVGDLDLFMFNNSAVTSDCTYVDESAPDWVLTIASTAKGDVTLVYTDPDDSSRKIVYRNPSVWICMCSNIVVLDMCETTIDYCDLPRWLCIAPHSPCCAQDRTEEVPETLFASFTSQIECFCAESASIPLAWDPVLNRWVGDANFGDCVSGFANPNTIHIELACNAGVSSSWEDFRISYALSGDFCSLSHSDEPPLDGMCDPLFLDFGSPHGDATGCCDLTPGGPGFNFSIQVSE